MLPTWSCGDEASRSRSRPAAASVSSPHAARFASGMYRQRTSKPAAARPGSCGIYGGVNGTRLSRMRLRHGVTAHRITAQHVDICKDFTGGFDSGATCGVMACPVPSVPEK